MKITKNTLRKLVAENLKESKDYKTLSEKFYPKSARKLGKDDDKRGGKVSHELEGEIEPSMMSELDPEIYPFADPGHPDHTEMKKRFKEDPSLFSDYRRDAKIKSMFYGKKGDPKTHRPKLTPEDIAGLEGLRFPEDMTSTQANRELSDQSRSELAPYDEGGESYSADLGNRRGPSKQKRKSNAIIKIENTQIAIQEKIIELENEGGQEARIEYLKGLYENMQEVMDLLATIRI